MSRRLGSLLAIVAILGGAAPARASYLAAAPSTRSAQPSLASAIYPALPPPLDHRASARRASTCVAEIQESASGVSTTKSLIAVDLGEPKARQLPRQIDHSCASVASGAPNNPVNNRDPTGRIGAGDTDSTDRVIGNAPPAWMALVAFGYLGTIGTGGALLAAGGAMGWFGGLSAGLGLSTSIASTSVGVLSVATGQPEAAETAMLPLAYASGPCAMIGGTIGMLADREDPVRGMSIGTAVGVGADFLASLPCLPGKSSVGRLGEGDAVSDLLYGARSGEGLPGAAGVEIPRRPSVQELDNLTAKHDVEFAVTYKAGPGKAGGGGKHYLHSGSTSSLEVPIEPDRMLIYHTHPRGARSASPADMEVMRLLSEAGSPQRSSQIVPAGTNKVTRFSATKSRF